MIKLNDNGLVELPTSVYNLLRIHFEGDIFLTDVFAETLSQSGYTQFKVSELCRVTPTLINHYCLGKQQPSKKIRELLKEIFPEEPYYCQLPDVMGAVSKVPDPNDLNWDILKPIILATKDEYNTKQLLKSRSINYLAQNTCNIDPGSLFAFCYKNKLNVNSLFFKPLPDTNPPNFEGLHNAASSSYSTVLKLVLAHKGMRVAELARSLDTNYAIANSWVAGRSKPKLADHLKLCRFFNVGFRFWIK